MVNSLPVSLDAHTSSMDSIELVLDVIGCPWWPLPSSSCLRIAISLSYWWSWYFKFSSWSRYQILGLIAAWLEHEALILFLIVRHFILNRCSVDWLPGIFGARLHLTILYHTINNLLIISACLAIATLPLGVLLVDKSHGKLTYIDRMIRVLHHNSWLLLLVGIRVLRLLDGSESTSSHFIVVALASIINSVCSAWRYTHLLTSGLDGSVTDILLLNRFVDCLKHRRAIVRGTTIGAGGSSWEEACLFTWRIFVLSCVKCSAFRWWRILSTSSACSDTSNMGCIRGITILTFHWLCHRIVQIHNQIIVDCVFIRRFWFSNGVSCLAIVSSCLCSSVECCNSFIWRCVLLVLFVDCSMLNGLIIEWVFPVLLNCLDWWAYELIQDFSSILDLLWVQWCRHVQVLFLLGDHIWVWWVVGVSSLLAGNLCFV